MLVDSARAFIRSHSSYAIIFACSTCACTAELTDGRGLPPMGTAGSSGAPATTGGSSGTGVGGANGSGSNSGSGSGSATGGSGAGVGTTGGAGGTGSVGSAGTTGTPDCTAPVAVPFRVMTRLNRAEYDNTVRDLLGETGQLARSLLPADFGDGAFDNNAAALAIDPALVEKYVELAQTLAERALAPGSAGRSSVLVCQNTDEACAREIAANFGARAWRRPIDAAETDGLFSLYTEARALGFSFEEGIRAVVAGALLAPDFLFRPELDPVLDSAEIHDVSGYELASRLSYFLWSSMPDAELTAAASSGALSTVEGIEAQLARMWSDPKADAFVQRFPGLWLRTADVTVAKQPASDIFPDFDASLEQAMEAETAQFMRDMVTGDVDFLSFLDAKYTYVNQRLAQFYGIPGQFGSELTRVELTGNTQRGGILTHASVLTVTSPAERTSPVIRGQWVLARLLASPAPPPPEDIPAIDVTPTTGTSMRQKLEAHRADPACSGCHSLMDPIGLGLENYDGIGRFRTEDNGVAVDASGALETGAAFVGALELSALLKSDPRVPRAVSQYVLSYALGREVGPADECLVGALTDGFEQDGRRISSLVRRVATTDPMLRRRGAL